MSTPPVSAVVNVAATTDSGICYGKVYGCTQPGMDNYDPTANIDDGSCQYKGCIDDGESNPLGGATTSAWGNYVCREGSATFTGDGDVTDESRDCLTNEPMRETYQMTLKVGEWLCECGAHPQAGGQPCDGNSQFETGFGEYGDPILGTYPPAS